MSKHTSAHFANGLFDCLSVSQNRPPPMCKEKINVSECSTHYKKRLEQIHNKWMIKYHEMCAPECHIGRTGKCVNALHKMLGSGMFILSL